MFSFNTQSEAPDVLQVYRSRDEMAGLQHIHRTAKEEAEAVAEYVEHLLTEALEKDAAFKSLPFFKRTFGQASKRHEIIGHQIEILKVTLYDARRAIKKLDCIIRETATWPSEIIVNVTKRRWITEWAQGQNRFDEDEYTWWNDHAEEDENQ